MGITFVETEEDRFNYTVRKCQTLLAASSREDFANFAKGMVVMNEYLGLKEDVCYKKATECLRDWFNERVGEFADRFGFGRKQVV